MSKYRPITLSDLKQLILNAEANACPPAAPIVLSTHPDMEADCPLIIIGCEKIEHPTTGEVVLMLIAGCALCHKVGPNSYTDQVTTTSATIASLFNARKEK